MSTANSVTAYGEIIVGLASQCYFFLWGNLLTKNPFAVKITLENFN